MKNTNKKAVATNQRLSNTLALFGVISIFGGMLVTEIIPMSALANDIVTYGTLAVGVALLIFGMKVDDNTDYYRCTECGHIHIPDFPCTLALTKELECPECNKRTIHKFEK